MNRKVGLGVAVVALAALLAGCGGSPGTTATPAPTATSASASSPAVAADLKTASSSAGQIVVDSKGMSLYFFTKDSKDSGTSACTGACLAAWPVFTTTADTPTADGVTGTLGTIATPDGKKQVTLNGLPLYYFAQDKKPGDVLGQGVNDVWYLVSPSGEMVKGAATSGY
ncbi:hypothetical protein ACPFL9_17810 [Paenarthrobacter sp. NyZ202]|uniref:COG4315 family predicted lipoprotein n=1 Tax=Paenarthrobacter sp. NyZ202 TaxID=3402689 RepID=UPI003CFA6858